MFTRANGQTPIPQVVIHQKKEFTSDLCLNLPKDWLCYCTKHGYIDDDGWYKAMRLFVKLSGAHETNIQALFFDEFDAHWDGDALEYLTKNFVQTFFLKSNDSENNQPNDNGFNAFVKAKYNQCKYIIMK